MADINLKVAFIGPPRIGKTRCCNSVFNEGISGTTSYKPTIGAGYGKMDYGNDGEKYKFHVWDTGGSEIYWAISHAFYRDAQVIYVFCDLSKENIELEERFLPAQLKDCQDAQFILVGTLAGDKFKDISEDNLNKLTAKLEEFAKEKGFGKSIVYMPDARSFNKEATRKLFFEAISIKLVAKSLEPSLSKVLVEKIQAYIGERSKHNEYYYWGIGRLFTLFRTEFSKTQKIAAAQALIASVQQGEDIVNLAAHKGALEQAGSGLNRLYQDYLKWREANSVEKQDPLEGERPPVLVN